MKQVNKTNNKLCYMHGLKRSWRIHEDKLRTMKSSIKTQQPLQRSFFCTKGPYSIDRYHEIERDNCILMNKINTIREKSTERQNLLQSRFNKENCKGSDKSNDKGNEKPEEDIKKSLNSTQKNFMKKTLNEPFRKRELRKIREQNEQMRRRIAVKKGDIDLKKLQSQRKYIESKINMISQFPYKDFRSTKTRINEFEMRPSIPCENSRSKTQDLYPQKRKRDYSRSPSSEAVQRIYQHDNQVILRIEQEYYLVNILQQTQKMDIELVNIMHIDRKYKLEGCEDILKEMYQNNLEKMLHSLQINQEGECFLTFTKGASILINEVGQVENGEHLRGVQFEQIQNEDNASGNASGNHLQVPSQLHNKSSSSQEI